MSRQTQPVPTQEQLEMSDLAELIEAGDPESARTLRADHGRGLRPKALAVVAAVAGACAVLALVALAAAPAHGGSRVADVQGTESKMGVTAMMGALATSLGSGSKLAKDVSAMYPTAQKDLNSLTQPLTDAKGAVLASPGVSKLKVNVTQMSNMSKKELLKPEDADRHDGNVCPDDEELHLGLCYKQCKTLTGGEYPIRTAAFSCCKERPCSFFNAKFTESLLPCTGLDTAGGREGGGCPHAPGECMPDEEFSLGLCYKKCALLTNNAFCFRSGAETCCRYNSHLACLDALNVNTSVTFGIGGGLGDHHNSTPGTYHAPMIGLTEKGVNAAQAAAMPGVTAATPSASS